MTEEKKNQELEGTQTSVEKEQKKRVVGVPFTGADDPRRWKFGRKRKDFKTLFEEAIIKIAEEKNIDPKNIETDLIIRAISEARGGRYQFYRDIFDRIYGKAKETIEFTDETPQENKLLNDLLKNASPEIQQQYREFLKKLLPDKRAGE